MKTSSIADLWNVGCRVTSIMMGFVLATTITTSAQDALESTVSEAAIKFELLGVSRIDGHAKDLSGLSDKLEDGSAANSFGGLSAMEYTGVGNRFLLLPDRGAGDGAVSYPCRFHEAELTLTPESGMIGFQLVATHFMKSSSGKSLVGSLTAHAEDLKTKDLNWTAFDPEGVRKLDHANIIVTDEYGPRVVIIDESGKITRELNVPESFRLREPVDGKYTRGAFSNRGLEGVAVTPSGNTYVAVIQSPLVQDGKIDDDKCLGINCRWLVYDRSGEVARQVVYQLDNVKAGVSEVLAVDEHRFLVLERDSKGGVEAKHKRVYLADIRDCTDVSGIDALPVKKNPKGVTVASKKLVLDLLDERFGLGGELAAEKPEGLAWGKTLADGRRTLWVCCDNDFDPTRKSEFYCFAVEGL
jgi:hypothetical protein